MHGAPKQSKRRLPGALVRRESIRHLVGMRAKKSPPTPNTSTRRGGGQNPGKGGHTVARAAHGREKTLIEQDRLPLPISCALDGLARHRAAGEPLDRVMAGIARERHLGPRERRATADLAFTWARHATAVEGYITKALKREGGVVPRRRQLDLAGLCLAGLATGHDVDVRAIEGLPPFLADLVEEAAATGLDLPVGIPAWLHQRLDAEHGADVVAALGRPGRPDLAVDVRRASVADVVAGLVAVGVPAEASPACATTVRVPVGALALHRLPPRLRKSVWPMDEGSQRVAAAMSAQPGERLLDLCAGGGGKSRVLAGTGAVVVAADVDAGRLRRSVPDGVIGVVPVFDLRGLAPDALPPERHVLGATVAVIPTPRGPIGLRLDKLLGTAARYAVAAPADVGVASHLEGVVDGYGVADEGASEAVGGAPFAFFSTEAFVAALDVDD